MNLFIKKNFLLSLILLNNIKNIKINIDINFIIFLILK